MATHSLAQQIEALRQQVSALETHISNQAVDTDAMIASGTLKRMQPMGATGGAPATTAIALPAPTPDMMSGMMAMMSAMMGSMSQTAPMGQQAGSASVLSQLPGYAGASHLYHVGATNFFLDHPEHIALSLDQQSQLGSLRTRSFLNRGEMNRRIQEREEQLWVLTSAEQPQYSLIDAKVREIEMLRSDLRLSFIKDVGQATSILTEEQRRAVLGHVVQGAPAAASMASPPAARQPMGDM